MIYGFQITLPLIIMLNKNIIYWYNIKKKVFILFKHLFKIYIYKRKIYNKLNNVNTEL